MICPKCTGEYDSICPCGYAPPSIKGVPVFRTTYHPRPNGISRDEFGRPLYDAIFTIGSILGIEQQRASAIHYGQGYKIKGLMARRAALQKDLANQLPQLTDHEMSAVLATYPWVVHA